MTANKSDIDITAEEIKGFLYCGIATEFLVTFISSTSTSLPVSYFLIYVF